MPLPCALNVASFLATLVVASSAEDNTALFLRHLDDRRESRGLQSGTKGPCIMLLLQFEERGTIQRWSDCIKEKEKTVDRKVAGFSYDIRQQCWCENGVEEVLKEYGCCESDDFKLYCMADCKPNCALPAAQKCIEDCPAACLETDYAPDFCSAGCQPCAEHMLCITEHSRNMTAAGHVDHPQHCDDAGFNDSPQWKEWSQCYAELPQRTHWHRHNAQNYCFCEKGLKAAAEQHKCCGATWGKQICDEQCATAQVTLDCTSAEAVTCMDTCNQACHQLFTEFMVPDCQAQCFKNSSVCEKYSVCRPAGPFPFDYLCDDGTAPGTDGCCGGRCPSLCSASKGYLFPHGLECQCVGCPATVDDGKKKFAKTLANDMDAHGINALASISKSVGILGANRKMQELMEQRNLAILTAFEAHPGSVDATWNNKAATIIDEYRVLIWAEAQAFKARGETDDPASGVTGTGTGAGTSGGTPTVKPLTGAGGTPSSGTTAKPFKAGKSTNNSSTVLIIVSISGAALVAMCGAFFLIYRLGKAKGQTSAPSPANPGMGSMVPIGGDNVVMGRPVDESAGGRVDPREAAQGAPVVAGGDSSSGPEKGGKGQETAV